MKYNVYFVEDEYMLREYVKSSQIWSGEKYALCGDASNGEDAWDEIQTMDVDILITDIKMPFMDGLELSRLVRANRPEIKVIILSGYDDFSYAKQALAIGVTDYLLKPLKPNDMLKTLDRAAEMIDEARQQIQSILSLQKMALDSLELNQHKFLAQLCNGFLPSSVIASKAQQLGLNLEAACYSGCILTIHEPGLAETDEDSYLTFMDCTQAIRAFSRQHSDFLWFSQGIHQFQFVISGAKIAEISGKAQSYLSEIQSTFPSHSKFIGMIGTPCDHISNLYTSMLSAQVAVNLLPQIPDSAILLASECSQVLSGMQYTSAEKELFRNLLKCGSLCDVPDFVSSMAEKLEQEHMSHLYLTYVCLDILTAVLDFTRGLGCDEDTISKLSIPNVIQLFDSGQSLSDFQEALRGLATQAITLRDQCRGGKNSDIIRRAKDFMLQHYAEPSLDLTIVAQRVNINSAYFSTLFKQETGQCFIEYLTSLRISRAKELLKTTKKRTADIAFEVGYNDQNYFSKLFKKCTGLSARDFRQH